MFLKRNRKNWEKNATERNGTGQEMERNGTGEETLRNGTKRPVCSHPVFIERASRSKGRTGGTFLLMPTVHVPYLPTRSLARTLTCTELNF